MTNSHKEIRFLVPNEDLIVGGSTAKECAYALEIQVLAITLLQSFFKEKRSFSESSPLFTDKSFCCVHARLWVGMGEEWDWEDKEGEFCTFSLKDLIPLIPEPLYFCSAHSTKVNGWCKHVFSITGLSLCSYLAVLLLNFSIKEIY